MEGYGASAARLAECAARRQRVARLRPRSFETLADAAARLQEKIRGLSAAGAELLAERGTKPTADGRLTWCRDPRIQAGPPIRLDRHQILAYLRGVRCPVLLIRPEDGWPVSAPVMEMVQDAIAELRLEPVPGGHHVHLETPERVAELIRDRFGVSYHFNHVGRLLRRLGFTPQKPQRRARQRNEVVIAAWRRERWPRIKKRDADGKLASCFSMKPASCCSR